MSDYLKDLLADAVRGLDRVKALASRIGLRYAELQPCPFGLGIAAAWSETRFVLMSTAAGGGSDQVYLTCGVLRDIHPDRLAALDACNSLTRDNPAYPMFLHDAEAGWGILMQTSLNIPLIERVPDLFEVTCRGLPELAEQRRTALLGKNLGGSPFRWSGDDLQQLLIRSVV